MALEQDTDRKNLVWASLKYTYPTASPLTDVRRKFASKDRPQTSKTMDHPDSHDGYSGSIESIRAISIASKRFAAARRLREERETIIPPVLNYVTKTQSVVRKGSRGHGFTIIEDERGNTEHIPAGELQTPSGVSAKPQAIRKITSSFPVPPDYYRSTSSAVAQEVGGLSPLPIRKTKGSRTAIIRKIGIPRQRFTRENPAQPRPVVRLHHVSLIRSGAALSSATSSNRPSSIQQKQEIAIPSGVPSREKRNSARRALFYKRWSLWIRRRLRKAQLRGVPSDVVQEVMRNWLQGQKWRKLSYQDEGRSKPLRPKPSVRKIPSQLSPLRYYHFHQRRRRSKLLRPKQLPIRKVPTPPPVASLLRYYRSHPEPKAISSREQFVSAERIDEAPERVTEDSERLKDLDEVLKAFEAQYPVPPNAESRRSSARSRASEKFHVARTPAVSRMFLGKKYVPKFWSDS